MKLSIIGYVAPPPPPQYYPTQYPQTYPQPVNQPSSPPMNRPGWTVPKRPLALMILAIVSIILICTATVLPWYYESVGSFRDDDQGKAEYTEDLGSFEVKIRNSDGSMAGMVKNPWSSTSVTLLQKKKDLAGQTSILLWLALTMNILVIVGAALAILGFSKMFALAFAALALLFCILAPTLYYVNHPGASRDQWNGVKIEWETASYESDVEHFQGPWSSFMGTYSGGDWKQEWHPLPGWWMALVTMFFSIPVLALAASVKRSPRPPWLPSAPLPAPTQAYPPGYPQQQYQMQPAPPPPQAPYQPPPPQQYPPPDPYTQQTYYPTMAPSPPQYPSPPIPQRKYCSYCGTALPDDARFCAGCGRTQ